MILGDKKLRWVTAHENQRMKLFLAYLSPHVAPIIFFTLFFYSSAE